MPAYDYQCQDCGERFEVRMSIAAYSTATTPACEACGSTHVARAFTAVNVLTGGRGGASSSPSCGSSGFG